MIYQQIKKLATEKGVSIYQIEKDCFLANGVIGKWGRTANQMPAADKLARVAKYLGTTVEFLLEEEVK